MAKARASAVVYGLVQGVFFRANAQKKAIELGLTGWVRNRGDGSVELVAEGEKEAVEALLSWCREGPKGAKVDKIEYSLEDFKGEFNSFSVNYR